MNQMKKVGALVMVAAFVLALAVNAADKKGTGKPSKFTESMVKRQYTKSLKSAGFKPSDLEVYSIGQSHIDAAWRWRYTQTRDPKVERTFRRALRHIDEYPNFNYHQSAPQYYEWTKEVDPQLFEKIVKAEKAGRWVAVGGMWIEPDGNMPEGESYARQQLYGQRFFLENFGHISQVAWLLDSFGYNWNLPQFVAKAGQKYMWTSKLTWNENDVFPFHLFWWQSPDGSKVLTHICPIVPLPEWFPFQELNMFNGKDYLIKPVGESNVSMVGQGGYKQTRYLVKAGSQLTANYLTSPKEIEAALSTDFMPVVGAFYGYGDGGHGPFGPEIDKQVALQDLGFGKIGTATQLFQAFEKYADRVPTWNDEMYLEYHQGVMTTHEWIKRANRKAEAILRTAEAASTTAFIYGSAYPMSELVKIWKIALLNQFHDILPGSSIPEVYQDARAHHKQIQDESNKIINNSLDFISAKIDTRPPRADLQPVLVYNPLGWDRTDPVKLEAQAGARYAVYDRNGKEIPSQVASAPEGGNWLYFKPDRVPALGWSTFYLKSGEPAAASSQLLVKENKQSITMENDLVRVTVDKKTGLLTSVFDKTQTREFLKKPSFKIMAFKDMPAVYSAWNIEQDYLKNPVEVPEPKLVKVDTQGPVFARVLIVRKGDPTSFKQWVTIYDDSPLVDLVTYTDMHWHMTLVKEEFNTTVMTDKVAADIPYAVIERSTHPVNNWDKARTEMPCQKWTDLSSPEAGIALVNFGKYGFSLNSDGTGWRMSIIKAAQYPKPTPRAHNVNTMYDFIPTRFTDQGDHWAQLALLPHKGTWREANVYRAGYEYNTPMVVYRMSSHQGELPNSMGMISIASDSAYIADLKKAEDDDSVIVRVVESVGKDTNAVLKIDKSFKVADALETDLIEMNPKPIKHDSSSVSFPVGHFEIKTIKIKLVAK